MDVDGKRTTIYACGTSAYVAEYIKDTALAISVGCGGESIGFFLKGKIVDSTYELNETNMAGYIYYESGYKKFTTNNTYKGKLTLTSGDGLRGAFEFRAIDTATGRVINITNGSFLLEKRYY